MGLDLEAIDLTPAGKRRLLRVAVDKDGGVTLDDIAEATKEVSRLLDESDVDGRAALHPGGHLARASTGRSPMPRHWRRNEGRLVKVALRDGGTRHRPDRRQRRALRPRSTSTARRDRSRYADVAKAKVQIEFNRKEG